MRGGLCGPQGLTRRTPGHVQSSDSHSMAKELKRREDELAAKEQPAGEPGAGES